MEFIKHILLMLYIIKNEIFYIKLKYFKLKICTLSICYATYSLSSVWNPSMSSFIHSLDIEFPQCNYWHFRCQRYRGKQCPTFPPLKNTEKQNTHVFSRVQILVRSLGKDKFIRQRNHWVIWKFISQKQSPTREWVYRKVSWGGGRINSGRSSS